MARRDRWGMTAHACDRFTYREAGHLLIRCCLDCGHTERGHWVRTGNVTTEKFAEELAREAMNEPGVREQWRAWVREASQRQFEDLNRPRARHPRPTQERLTMKLTVCPTCHKACDLCGQPLHIFAFCPPCAGRQGGSSTSLKKQEASRQNLTQARLRSPRRPRRERGQVIRL